MAAYIRQYILFVHFDMVDDYTGLVSGDLQTSTVFSVPDKQLIMGSPPLYMCLLC